jgi:hypothetical protein
MEKIKLGYSRPLQKTAANSHVVRIARRNDKPARGAGL